jgi:hypothetical protein
MRDLENTRSSAGSVARMRSDGAQWTLDDEFQRQRRRGLAC